MRVIINSIVFFLLPFLVGSGLNLNAKPVKVPGVVVNYIPASTKNFIGTPSICVLPNGDYIASHDHF